MVNVASRQSNIMNRGSSIFVNRLFFLVDETSEIDSDGTSRNATIKTNASIDIIDTKERQ
jgi:hypothetical protein